MRRFVDFKIKHKLVAFALLTSLVVLGLASIVMLVNSVHTAHRSTRNELATIARIIGANSAAAMLFGDEKAATETLATVSVKSNIVGAFLFDNRGRIFARFLTDDAPAAWRTGDEGALAELRDRSDAELGAFANLVRGGLLGARQSVVIADDSIGVILVASDFRDVIYAAATNVLAMLTAILVSIAIATLVAVRLQGVVSRPMYRLVATMDKVSREENYAIRADKQGDDELGDLTDGFNRMLAAIQARDENLRNAHREAELANRAKTEFLANMSHELRTPLNAIIGFSEILSREMMGPIGTAAYLGYANDIHDSGQHLLAIINDILEISRIESGKLALRDANLDVADIVNRAVRLVRDRAAAANLQLAVDVPQGLPPLYADERLLKQSLLNLLTNAVKFTRPGGVIVVTVARAQDGGMIFTVRDSGIGIEAHNLEKIFQPFYQVDSSLSRTQEGLGLGLPLVKSFMELHGGHVSIESDFGRGTIVRLHFPVHRCGSGEASSLLVVERV